MRYLQMMPKMRSLGGLLQYSPDDYDSPNYIPTGEVVDMHEWPRFRWPRDITYAFESQDQRSQYLWGVTIGSLITLFVFIVWALVLLCLKCAGKRVGCASGKPRRPDEPSVAGGISETVYQDKMNSYAKAVKKHERRLMTSRIIFLAAGVLVIVSTILFYVKGVGSLVQALKDVQISIGDTEEILTDLYDTTGDFIALQKQAEANRTEFVDSTQGICGRVVDATVTAALQAGEIDDETLNQVDEVITELSNILDNFGEELRAQADGLQVDLAEAISLTQNLNSTVDQAYPFLYCTAAFMAVLIIIVICLMIETVMAWRSKKMRNCFVKCMRNGVILPLFFLFILLSWLFASLFQLAAIGSADFCIQPDKNVEFLLDKYVKERMSPVLFTYLTYYLRCSGELRINLVDESGPLWAVIAEAHDAIEYLQKNADAVSAVCNGEGGRIQNLLTTLHVTLHGVNDLLIILLNLLKCSTFNPIYVGVLHSGLCVNGAAGLAWLFSTLLCMAVGSMIMITFRAGRSESKVGKHYLQDVDGGYEPYSERSGMAGKETIDDLKLAEEEGPPVIEPDT